MTRKSKRTNRETKSELARRESSIQHFVALVHKLAYRRSPQSVFADFCEISAIALSNPIDTSQRPAREARYVEIAKRFNRKDRNLLAQMFEAVVDALSSSPHDFLGDCLKSVKAGKKSNEQFSNSYEISLLGALVVGGDLTNESINNAGGFVALHDSTCGSGSMSIAFADMLSMKGINYQQVLHVTAQDIDPTSAYMCYVQLSLLMIPATVQIGDSLIGEIRERWVTAPHILGGWNQRLPQSITKPAG